MVEKLILKQEDDLLLQSYMTFSLLAELHNHGFINSNYFKEMNFGARWIQESLPKVGIDNQGCAMIALYSMLVLPKEVVQDTYSAEYEDIQQFVKVHARVITSTYKRDHPEIDFIRHIRNAVAHANAEFRPCDVIIFNDKNSRTGEEFRCELPLDKLGQLLNELQRIHVKYLHNLPATVS